MPRTPKTSPAHPLAQLRKRDGLSHADYARLVARTHAELGFGSMADRREKVARWESGRVTPELTAQLTIAHLHGVVRADVLRLGWPHWLHLASDATAHLHAPWSADDALSSLRALTHPHGGDHRAFLTCETTLEQLAMRWQEQTVAPQPIPTRPGSPLDPATVAALDARHRQIRTLYLKEGASTTRILADSELRLVCDLIHTAGYGPAQARLLLSAAANAACLSGWLAYELGDHLRAQDSYAAALRISALGGDLELGLWALVLLAEQQMSTGHPAQGLALLAPADDVCRTRVAPGSRLTALVRVAQGTAYALHGRPEDALRHFEDARTAHAETSPDVHPLFTDWLTRDSLENLIGIGLVHCGLHQPALDQLAPLHAAGRTASSLTERERALAHVHLGRAHLALGAVEHALRFAAQTARFLAASPTSTVSACLKALHGDLRAHLHVPAVQQYFHTLGDSTLLTAP
ncbi:hypothetical protein AB0G73_01375 [Streptomyces sp. NPDC020719]|uniref:hypothetical protein n=1 Tax=unclassified Streptomyces TaxID=2593676 RepID=UPI00340AAC92